MLVESEGNFGGYEGLWTLGWWAVERCEAMGALIGREGKGGKSGLSDR